MHISGRPSALSHSMMFVTVVLSALFSSACLYLVLHAILIMVQATTLNVAFNSHNKSLLTIMMSNNVSIMYTDTFNSIKSSCSNEFSHDILFCFFLQFVEIKGSVFKKFGKNNLFQMSNSGKIINVISEIFYLIHHFKS